MATLPSDRTKLAAAQANQVAQTVASGSKNREALTEVYDTVDMLYNFTTGLVSAGTISRLGIINVKDYGASGSAQTFTGSISAGSRTLTLTTGAHDFVAGQGIAIPGAGVAGVAGAALVTTVSNVQGSSGQITLATAASTAVSGQTIRHDDSASIQAAVDAGNDIVFPDGNYRCSEIYIPSDCSMRFSANARIIPNDQKTIFLAMGSYPSEYVSLSKDAATGDHIIELASVSGLTVGDWIYIRSDSVLSGINAYGNKTAEIRKIESINVSLNKVTLNEGLCYDFNISDSAECGRAEVKQNIEIYGMQINDYGYTQLFDRGILMRFAANVRIVAPRFIGSREVGGVDINGNDGITIDNSFNISIEDGYFNNIAWYGVSFHRTTQHAYVNNCIFEKCRHATSLVYSDPGDTEYGEPHQINIENCKSFKSTLSAFDSHNTGRDVTYLNCEAYDSGDNAFQIRNDGCTRLLHCKGIRSTLDGVKIDSGSGSNGQINRVVVVGGVFTFNRYGLNTDAKNCSVFNAEIHDNTTSGIMTQGGDIEKCSFIRNGGATNGAIRYGNRSEFGMSMVTVKNCYFKNESQNLVIHIRPVMEEADFSKLLRLIDNVYDGYSNYLQATVTGGVPSPLSYGNVFSSEFSLYTGRTTLVAGEVTITSAAIKYTNPTTYRAVIPKIKLTVASVGGTPGSPYVSAISNGSITIKSTSSSDTSTLHWDISY